MLADLYPPLENAFTIPVTYTVMLPMFRTPLPHVEVVALPPLRWWRRALAWFVAPTLPEARAR
jgi:hypothetical protein